MRNEEDIRSLLSGMYKHARYIKDDFQRYGFDNFICALEYVLNDNGIINAQIESRAKEQNLRVDYVRIGDKDVDLRER